MIYFMNIMPTQFPLSQNHLQETQRKITEHYFLTDQHKVIWHEHLCKYLSNTG